MVGGCPAHGDLRSSTPRRVTPGLSYKSLIPLLQPVLVLSNWQQELLEGTAVSDCVWVVI